MKVEIKLVTSRPEAQTQDIPFFAIGLHLYTCHARLQQHKSSSYGKGEREKETARESERGIEINNERNNPGSGTVDYASTGRGRDPTGDYLVTPLFDTC